MIDFGISRAAEATALTHADLVIGSPGFMSPEQAEGRETGPPSDVFSLGAVLAFAASGQGPFGTGSTAALVYRVVHGTPALDAKKRSPDPRSESGILQVRLSHFYWRSVLHFAVRTKCGQDEAEAPLP